VEAGTVKTEQVTTSLPHLSGGRGTDLKDRNGHPEWKQKSVKPFDARTVLPALFAPSPRPGSASVREMSKKFEGSSQSSGNGEKLIFQPIRTSREESNPNQEPTASTFEQSSGRSFLNDTNPVSGISDILDRMRWTPGETGTQEDAGLGLLNKFIGAQVLMQGIEPMLNPVKVRIHFFYFKFHG
jgi:hypothetical protein